MGQMVIFRLTRQIRHQRGVEYFHRIVSERVRTAPSGTKVVFDLYGTFRVSSMAVGSMIGTLGSVVAVAVVRPPVYMRLVFRRSRFGDFGIQMKDSVEKCLS